MTQVFYYAEVLMLTLEDHLKNWEEAIRPGSIQERLKRTQRWMPYYSAMAEKQAKMIAAASSSGKKLPAAPHAGHGAAAFVSRLKDQGYLDPSFTVLDIGAGSGGFSLALAPYVSRITALDPCTASLELLKERSLQNELNNIECVNCPWELYENTEQFDLVTTSMCPAICDLDALMNMERLAKKRCVIITVFPTSVDPNRRNMMQELGIKPRGMVTPAGHYINVLYALDRCPEVFRESFTSVSRITRDRALDHYTQYFSIFGVDPKVSADYINGYFDKYAEDGVITEESCMDMAMITWKK